MFELLKELIRSLGLLAVSLISWMGRAGLISFTFIRDTFRAHYNLLGQYTAPIETELLGTEPPTPSSLNIFGQIALTLIPVTVLAWIISLTIAPLVYNFFRFIKTSIAAALSLSVMDDSALYEKVGFSEDDLTELKSIAWYRYLYGIPGLLVGSLIGLGLAAGVMLFRVLVNSFESLRPGFALITNLALEQEDRIGDNDDRKSRFKTYILGAPGFFIGAVFGLVNGLPIAILGRVVVNSFKNIMSLTISGINLVNEESFDEAFTIDLKPSFLRKYVLGFPGLIIGVFAAALGTVGALTWRVLINSYHGARASFIAVVNVVLHAEDEFKEPPFTEDNRSFGLPGVLLGSFVGIFAFHLVLLARIASNTFRTTIKMTVSAANVVLDEKESFAETLQNDNRSDSEKILGAFGYILGSFTAALALVITMARRVLIESWLSAKIVFNRIAHEAKLITEDDLQELAAEQNEERSPVNQYLFGGLGLLVGLLVGSLRFAGTLSVHILEQSYESAKRSFISFTMLGLHQDHEFSSYHFGSDNRAPKRIFGFGFPGLILGGFAGIFGLLIVGFGRNSYETAKRLVASALNAVRDEQLEEHFKNDKRNRFLKAFLGFPGLIIGSVGAFFAVSIVALNHSRIESWISTKEFFYTIVNFALDVENESSFAKQRSKFKRYVVGGPGVVLGVFVGSIASVGIVLVRIVINSFNNIKEMGFWGFDLVHEEEEDESAVISEANNERSFVAKYLLGFPGLFLGLFSAAFGMIIAALHRLAIESFKTARIVYFKISNAAKEDEYLIAEASDVFMNLHADLLGEEENLSGEELTGSEKPIVRTMEQTNKKRSFVNHYLFGAPGLLLGGLTGLVGFAGIIGQRVVKESYRAAKQSFITIINLALDSSDVVDQENYNRPLKPGFGFVGFPIGGVIGAIAFVGIGFGRTLTNSWETIRRTNVSIVNWVRLSPLSDSLETDGRSPFRIYVLGAPGLIIGIVFGAIDFVFEAVGRVVIQSYDIAFNLFIVMTATALAEEDEFYEFMGELVEPGPYADFFGFPGYFLGLLAGTIGFVIAGISRIGMESWDTGVRMFSSLANLGLDAENNEQIPYAQLESNDRRSPAVKYLVGFPGVLVGGFLGGLGLTSIAVVKFANQSFKSWLSLSGSLLNGSLRMPLFSGLGGDDRNIRQKIIGGLGYLFALITTLPLSILIFAFKTVIPAALGLLLGAVSSPFIAVGKAISLGLNPGRFDKQYKSTQWLYIAEEQRFKNLYSSTTVWGQFEENELIKTDQDGRKGPKCFIRKAFTFNLSSIPENLLDNLLTAYRECPSTNRKHFFDDNGAFLAVVKKVKDYYNELSCLEPSLVSRDRDEQIEALGQFIKNYIREKVDKVPEHIYSNPKKSWSAIFWGEEPAPRQDDLSTEPVLRSV